MATGGRDEAERPEDVEASLDATAWIWAQAEARGITRKRLAAEAGFREVTVGQWIRRAPGTRGPSYGQLLALCRVVGVDFADYRPGVAAPAADPALRAVARATRASLRLARAVGRFERAVRAIRDGGGGAGIGAAAGADGPPEIRRRGDAPDAPKKARKRSG
jgi:transcriptional regulator with XRE-family HTH domain